MTEDPNAIFVFFNPVAGRTDPEAFLRLLEERCTACAQIYEIHQTQPEDDVTALARSALEQGYRRFAAAGGDGTVAAVADGLIGSEAVLGVLPAGTANVLAAELGIPADMGQAIDLLLAAPATRTLDAMKMGGKHYLLHIGVGITSLMQRDTSRESKRRFGRLAYLATAVRWLLDFQPTRFMIVVDGVRHRHSASQVMIANGGKMGGAALHWAETIDPADGQIDVVVVYAETLRDYLRVGISMLIGRQRSLGRVQIYSARRHISLSSRSPLPVQADGELAGKTPVQVEVVKGAVRVVVPGATSGQ